MYINEVQPINPVALAEFGGKLPCLACYWSVRYQFLAIFLPFLGYNNGKKDPNTCFPIYVDVTWPIKAFPFGLVESKAGLPCLAFFGQKRDIFGPFSAIFGSCQGVNGP